MTFREPVVLGRTGLSVGRLGVASGYKAPAAAIEEAFERGCNYFTWGTVIKGFSPEMRQAIRNIAGKGMRERLVLAMFTYAHNNFFTESRLRKGLRSAGIDYADVLILGYFSRRPPQKLIDGARRLKDKGLVRFIGLSSHNRKLIGELAGTDDFDVYHVRYNAAHRGAETEAFPCFKGERKPGLVAFNATRVSRLLKPKNMPPGEKPPSAADCYRFVLSHPSVDVCLTGARSVEMMRENLAALDHGPMTEEELTRMRRIGDFVHG